MCSRHLAQSSARTVWYVVILLAMVNVFSFADRMALSVLAGLIQKDIHLSDTQLGLLTGFAFSLFYAVCGIPIARMADRANRRNIIVTAISLWSVMTALTGMAQTFWQLFLARVGIAIGEAGGHPPGQSIICDYVPFTQRASALAVHLLGNGIGAMLGMALAGALGATVGWRLTFVVLGLPGIALALLVLGTLREPPRGICDSAHDHADMGRLPLPQTLRILWKNLTFRHLLLFAVWQYFAIYGLIQWWPTLYVRVFALDLPWVGLWLGIAIGVGSAIGGPVGGLLADSAARRNPALPMRIGAVATLLTGPAALGSLFAPSAQIAIWMVFVALLLWGVSDGPVLAARLSVVPAHMRATASAIVTFLGYALGAGLAPLTVGVISDLLTPALGAESLRYAMIVPICFMWVTMMALRAAAKTLPEDLKASGVQIMEDQARDACGKVVADIQKIA